MLQLSSDLGHTAFDDLMIAILEAHTSITPETTGVGRKNERRFCDGSADVTILQASSP